MRADSDALLQLVFYKSMEPQLGEMEKKMLCVCKREIINKGRQVGVENDIELERWRCTGKETEMGTAEREHWGRARKMDAV